MTSVKQHEARKDLVQVVGKIGIFGPIGSGKSTLAQALDLGFKERGISSGIIPIATGVKNLSNSLLSIETTLERNVYAYFYFAIYLGFPDDVSRKAAAMAAEFTEKFSAQHQMGKPRQLYQYIGTEVGRNILSHDIWMDIVERERQRKKYSMSISDDVRFDNEAESMDFLIQISVEQAPEQYQRNISEFSASYLDSSHASERGVSVTPDAVIPCGFNQKDVQSLLDTILLRLDNGE